MVRQEIPTGFGKREGDSHQIHGQFQRFFQMGETGARPLDISPVSSALSSQIHFQNNMVQQIGQPVCSKDVIYLMAKNCSTSH
jgi:hypothetical protein